MLSTRNLTKNKNVNNVNPLMVMTDAIEFYG